MAPEADEIQSGRPFAGGAGRILNRGLHNAGIDRADCYVDNVVKCFVPKKTHIPEKAIECCRPLLQQSLDCLRGKRAIVSLGIETFKALTGSDLALVHNIKAAKKNSLYWLRGCVHRATTESTSNVIIPTYHPAGVAYAGFAPDPYFAKDLEKAARWMKGQGHVWRETIIEDPTDQEVEDYIDECLTRNAFAVDIETPETVVDNDEEEYAARAVTPIDLVGLSARRGECISVRRDQLPRLSRLFAPRTDKPTCAAFNWGFDGYHLGTHFSVDGVRPFDGMLALNCLYSDVSPKDLATALSLFTDMPYHKNLMARDMLLYNARDTYGALYLMEEQIPEMQRWAVEQVFWDQDMPLIPVVEEMRLKGIRCDVPYAQRAELMCHAQLSAYEQWWHENIPTVDWQSPQQLIEYFRLMGMPIRQKTRKAQNKDGSTRTYKSPTIDEEVLEEYVGLGNQVAKLVLAMRRLKKAGEFTHFYSADGRAHPHYKIHGQRMGRIQAKEPDIQNFPERAADIFPRRILLPDDDDSVLITADFSQVELWIYAYAANDIPFLLAKRSGDYIYGQLYEEIFPGKAFFQPGMPRMKAFKSPDVIPSDLLIAKSGPLGMLYGRGVDSLMNLGVTRDKAKEIYDRFFSEHHAIREFHKRLEWEVNRQGYLRNFFGRIRRFPNPRGQRGEWLAFPGQCNGADILRYTILIPGEKVLPDFNARFVLTVHDSIGITCPKRNAVGCAEWVRESMESPIPQMRDFWIPSEVTIGPNWHDTIGLEEFIISEREARKLH